MVTHFSFNYSLRCDHHIHLGRNESTEVKFNHYLGKVIKQLYTIYVLSHGFISNKVHNRASYGKPKVCFFNSCLNLYMKPEHKWHTLEFWMHLAQYIK